MQKLKFSYHLPHNSIRVDEFNFMLNAIDTSYSYYTYEELRLLFLEKEIESDVFQSYHKIVHKNLLNNNNNELKALYIDAINGDKLSIKKMLQPGILYTGKKSFMQVWNESVRDYTEFFAFLGLLPTYYKGLSGGDNRHYVTSQLKKYVNNKITLRDLLLSFKFRNSSKDYNNLEMYHIEVRPFVLAIKALKYYKNKNILTINPHIISAIVSYSHNEFNSLQDCLDIFTDPQLKICNYKDNFVSFTNNTKREIERVTLLLKPYLKSLGIVEIVKYNRGDYYKITNLIDEVKFPNKSVFCNGEIGKYKLTPLIGKIIYACFNNPSSILSKTTLFDDNFNEIDIDSICEELHKLGIIKSNSTNDIETNDIEKQYDINPYSDFMTYNDACYVTQETTLHLSNNQIQIKENNIKHDLQNLKKAALSSDGTLYENTLYEFIKNKLTIFDNINWYGANATGKRISDIAATVKIYDKGITKNILIVVECKAARAIKAFDERKERDDIINVLKMFRKQNISFDGVWYWVADSDSLPDTDIHGGYRSNQMNKSFIEKLNILQFDISEESRMPAIVTAFSIDALSDYLSYIYDNSHNLNNTDSISETIMPHFWRWSKKFMNVQYVTIHNKIYL